MKRLLILVTVTLISLIQLLIARRGDPTTNPPQGFSFERGAVNRAVIVRNGAALAIYGPAEKKQHKYEHVLITHHRRDVANAARHIIERGTPAAAPAAERSLIAKPEAFWKGFQKSRFHDYAQQTTKVLTTSLPVKRWVKDGDVIKWRGLQFQVLATPGYTPGAVSYVTEIDGQRIAFTGDLIYGDGQLLDLYSLQDAIPEAQIRGYHGYASRLAKLIPSLEKVAALKPDLLVPARGPMIRRPQAAIDKLIRRVRKLYHNYLSTNALNWYFKEKRMRLSGKRVLGQNANVALMSYSEHRKPPAWVWGHSTSRLLIAKNGHGFLLDCGYQNVIKAVKKLMTQGRVKKIDGIFVTHCHDDHTDQVQAAAEAFQCPVYALVDYQDVLERPAAYHLPALTTNAIKKIRGVKDGHTMQWQEFSLSFHTYPGQMFHHGALLVQKRGERPIFFIGDSFSPSGIDDYCLLNRNLIHEDGGYFRCLKKLRTFRGDYWLVNEHIPFVFTFSGKELDYLEKRYRKRAALLRELFPWDDPNYGIDEQWAVFYPYGTTVSAGNNVALQVRLTNHSPRRRTFTVTPRLPKGFTLVKNQTRLTLGPRQTGAVAMTVRVPRTAGEYVLTADVASKGMAFRDWVEAMVIVN